MGFTAERKRGGPDSASASPALSGQGPSVLGLASTRQKLEGLVVTVPTLFSVVGLTVRWA